MSCNASQKPSCVECSPKVDCDLLFGPLVPVNPCEDPCVPGVCPLEEPRRKPSRLKFEVEPIDDGQLWKCTKVVAPPKPVKWRCPEKKKKPVEKKLGKPLGTLIGACFGSFTICSPNIKLFDELMPMQGYATCFMAFGEIFITPEGEWDNAVLNRIIMEGKEHVSTALEAAKTQFKSEQAEKAEKEAKENVNKKVVDDKAKGAKKKETPGKAKEVEKPEVFSPQQLTEQNISKSFIICGNSMEIAVLEPFIIGVLQSTDHMVPNFYYGIDKFMRKFKYCLLTVCKQYYVIWKSSGVFFVYDCYGRNNKLEKKPKSGCSALISLCTLENVNHLIVNMSKLPPTEPFMIRQIKMIQVLACSTVDKTIERRIRQREYEIINDHHAVLKGHLHLGTSCFKENRDKFALAVAMTTIIISKIDTPSTWDRYCVDKVLTTGHKYYTLWTNCRHTFELKLRNIPTVIEIGKFDCFITISQVEACGAWMCIPNYKQSEITSAIKKVFQKSPNLIVQVSSKIYPLIKRGNFYYVLDPYHHDCRGGKTKIPYANLHMFSTLNMLCCVFSNQIVELPFPSTFFIHTVTIKYIRNKLNPPAEIASCKCSVVKEREEEVMSLNDSLGDVTGKKELTCVAEKYGFVPDEGNLDSPGMSQTQICPEYDDLKGSESEETDELEESDSEDDSDDDGTGKKGKKGKKGKTNKGEKDLTEKSAKDEKEKGEKNKKDKAEKDKKDKEEKDKKDKAEKDKKDKAEKDKKDKAEKDKEGKDKKDKGGDDNANKDKDKDKEKDKDKDKSDLGKSKLGKDGKDDEKSGEEEDGKGGKAGDKQVPEGCLPNKYPGYSCVPYNLVVAGSESGDYESLCNLLKTGFKCSDRILTMTPWGNYVAFKSKAAYLLYDGCTCNVKRFRHLDLTIGTAGLLCFWTIHDLLEYIIRGKGNKSQKALNCEKKYLDRVIDQICDKYGGKIN